MRSINITNINDWRARPEGDWDTDVERMGPVIASVRYESGKSSTRLRQIEKQTENTRWLADRNDTTTTWKTVFSLGIVRDSSLVCCYGTYTGKMKILRQCVMARAK